MSDIQDQLILKGTTTIGVVCKEGVILASDTRVTMGNYVAHKKGKKVYEIADHLAITISGSVADAQWIVEALKVNAKLFNLNTKRLMPVSAAARLAANIFFSARYAPLIAQILVGGVDESGPHIFSLDPLGSLIEEKCVATGSGSTIAYGVLEAEYKEETSINDLLPVVLSAVSSAMKRDIYSGDSFNISIIDGDGYRELNEEEKENLSKNK
jgi:proteasome beta subunit